MPNIEQTRLLTVAELSARFLGYAFEPGCWSLMEEALANFGTNLPLPATDPAAQTVLTADDRLRLAEARTAEWVGVMVQEALRIGMRELHEPTFGATALRLCPFWPFC